MNEAGIKKLAELSRLELTEAEISSYAGEFSNILSYVDSLKSAVSVKDEKQSQDQNNLILENSINRNVMRDDIHEKESGEHTSDVVASAPDSHNGYIKVKKILN